MTTDVGRAPRLSLCMIVKNEEEYLAKCLESMQGVADEFIVVDTGSTDKTVEIAERFGAKVSHFDWINDFSAARNFSLEQATGDWIIYLDADEELAKEDGPVLRELLENPDVDGYLVQEQSFVGDRPGMDATSNITLRVFRNRPKYRFTGRLHEQISRQVQAVNPNIPIVPVHIYHYGYLNKPMVAKDKICRNLEILELENKENPHDPFTLFNLGVEYLRLGEHEKSLAVNQEAYERMPSVYLGYSSILVRNIVVALSELKRYDQAFKVLDDAEKVFTDYTDLLFLRGLILAQMGRHRDAVDTFGKCLEKGESASRHIRNEGVGGFKALLCRASAYEQLGEFGKALADYVAAYRANPRFTGSLYRLGKLLLKYEKVEDVRAYLARMSDHQDHATLIALGTLFRDEGQNQVALEYFDSARAILDSPRLELLIGEARLNLGDNNQALAEFMRIAPDKDYYGLAQLDATFCLAVQGRVEEARAVLAKLPVGETLAEVQAVYRLWLDLQEDNPHDVAAKWDEAERAASIGWNLLLKLLELREFDLFEKSLPLLAKLGVSPAKQALELGRAYAKHGYEDMALESLIAAFQAGEMDADALLATGDICRKRGDYENAAVFYAEATKLEPQRISLYTALSSALIGQGDYKGAAGVLKEALKHSPNSDLLKGSLQTLEALSGLSRAEEGR